MLVALRRTGPVPTLVVGFVACALGGLALIALMATATYDAWGPLLIAPGIVLISLPALARIARADGSPRLFGFLVFALVLKLVASLARYYVMNDVYNGGDALGYDAAGRTLAPLLRGFSVVTPPEGLTGTGFMNMATGVVYAIAGPSIIGGFMVFSWLSFWGLVLWFRAFRLAIPSAGATRYAGLLFLMPSTLFWPSSIGKEAWMTLALGIAAYGVARLLTRGGLRAIGIVAIGLWAAALVRPHFAVLVVAAATLAYTVRRAPGDRRSSFGPAGKAVVLVALLGMTSMFIARTQTFFEDSNVAAPGGSLTDILAETQRRSSTGGSEFSSRVVTSPLQVPGAVATVLFRPLPTEAHSMTALLAALESTFIAGLVVIRRRRLWAALRSTRTHPYVAFALGYVVLFCSAFASVGNFGIIARQRSLALPALMVLFAHPEERAHA